MELCCKWFTAVVRTYHGAENCNMNSQWNIDRRFNTPSFHRNNTIFLILDIQKYMTSCARWTIARQINLVVFRCEPKIEFSLELHSVIQAPYLFWWSIAGLIALDAPIVLSGSNTFPMFAKTKIYALWRIHGRSLFTKGTSIIYFRFISLGPDTLSGYPTA